MYALAPAWKLAGLATALAVTVAAASRPAQGENSQISIRRAAERTSFTDAEITAGFLKLAFRAELQLDRAAERIRKFDEPVRVTIVGHPDRRTEIAAIVTDIRARVAHLDIAITDDFKAANFIVMLVPKRDFQQTVRSLYGKARARQIRARLRPQCLSGIGKDESYRIRRAEVLRPVDVDDFSFYDCAYEEILQGLGVINDDTAVPWTMFNDDVRMGFFDVYDQYLLNVLYDPRIRPGMTKEEFGKLAPEVLPTVRAWMSRTKPSHSTDGPSGSTALARASPDNAVN